MLSSLVFYPLFSAVTGMISGLFHLVVRPCRRHVKNQLLLQALLYSHLFTLSKELLEPGVVFRKARHFTFTLLLPVCLVLFTHGQSQPAVCGHVLGRCKPETLGLHS